VVCNAVGAKLRSSVMEMYVKLDVRCPWCNRNMMVVESPDVIRVEEVRVMMLAHEKRKCRYCLKPVRLVRQGDMVMGECAWFCTGCV
jgi:hypothetical protein